MDIDRITGEAERIIECAEAIKSELENNSGDDDDAIQLYEDLNQAGCTTDADEIVASVELVAELSTDDAAEINSALELWESVNSNGHDTDDIGDALDVYAIVENSSIHRHELEGSLELVDEWNKHCGHIWESPEAMAQGFSDQGDIVAIFERATARSLVSAEDAREAVSQLGNAGVSNEERALLDAISALCVKQAGTKTVPATWKLSKPVPAFGSTGINSESKE
jgi:hypothetical protein